MSDAWLDHLEQQERINTAVEAKIDDAPPHNKMTPTDIINLACAYWLANGELNYGLNKMVSTSTNEMDKTPCTPHTHNSAAQTEVMHCWQGDIYFQIL